MMQTDFSRGVLAGLQAEQEPLLWESATGQPDYQRGWVLGYSHRLAERNGDCNMAAFSAGILSRRYGLDRELVAESFAEVEKSYIQRYFYAGYDREIC